MAMENEATPKLRMVAKTRIESTSSIEQARKEEAMGVVGLVWKEG